MASSRCWSAFRAIALNFGCPCAYLTSDLLGLGGITRDGLADDSLGYGVEMLPESLIIELSVNNGYSKSKRESRLTQTCLQQSW